MQKLPKNYSKRGAFLVCPHCNHETHVGHFAWVALVCLNCRAEVNKEDWYLSDWQNAQQNAHPTLGKSATSQAESNAETLSTSDGVPPSAPARVA